MYDLLEEVWTSFNEYFTDILMSITSIGISFVCCQIFHLVCNNSYTFEHLVFILFHLSDTKLVRTAVIQQIHLINLMFYNIRIL